MHASLTGCLAVRVLNASVLLVLLTLCVACAAPAPAPASGAQSGGDTRADWPAELVLGIATTNIGEAAIERDRPLAEFISKRVGLPVKYEAVSNYGPIIEAIRDKRVHAANLGPFPYILAVEEAGAEPLGVQVDTRKEPAVYDPALRPSYFSVIVTKKGSGITRLEELKGRSFSFVDPVSASGHLVPKAFLVKNAISPDQDLKAGFAGSHPKSITAVWEGKAEAGASAEVQLYNLAQSGQIELCGFPDGEVGKDRGPAEIKALFDACPAGKVAMLAYSDPVPNGPFAIRADLPPSLKAAVREAVLALKDEPELVARTKRWYLDPHRERGLPSLDAYYNPLRETARVLNLDLRGLE